MILNTWFLICIGIHHSSVIRCSCNDNEKQPPHCKHPLVGQLPAGLHSTHLSGKDPLLHLDMQFSRNLGPLVSLSLSCRMPKDSLCASPSQYNMYYLGKPEKDCDFLSHVALNSKLLKYYLFALRVQYNIYI